MSLLDAPYSINDFKWLKDTGSAFYYSKTKRTKPKKKKTKHRRKTK